MTNFDPLIATISDDRILISQTAIPHQPEKYYPPPPPTDNLTNYLLWGAMAAATAIGFFFKQGTTAWIASQEKRMQLAIEQEVKRSEASMAITSELLKTAISANKDNHALQHELLQQLINSTLSIMERSLQQSGATDNHVQSIETQLLSLKQIVEKYNDAQVSQLEDLSARISDLYRAQNIVERRGDLNNKQ
jgi:hypothetical protein